MKAIQLKIAFPLKGIWIQISDGDSIGLRLYKRHYSCRKYKDGRIIKRYVGPGEYISLATPDGNALFVWRKFISMDHQEGVNCSIFRNETNNLSSKMICEAEEFAIEKWGQVRAYTYINPKKIKSINPGYCFIKAGWNKYGYTKSKLLILEKYLKIK